MTLYTFLYCMVKSLRARWIVEKLGGGRAWGWNLVTLMSVMWFEFIFISRIILFLSRHCVLFIIIGVWTPLTELLRSWASSRTIHVFLGSVLDTNRDGRRDNDANYTWWLGDKVGGVAIPTHFYAVVVRCLDSSSRAEPADCDPDKLDTVGLLFQHPTELGV